MRLSQFTQRCVSPVIFALLISHLCASAAAQSPGRVLYAFSECGLPDTPLIADARGNLYGGTSTGGTGGRGCIFELSPSQSGWQQTVLYNFSGPDGEGPRGSLVFDKAGNLYGTTITGGAYQSGTAFELSPSGKWQLDRNRAAQFWSGG